MRILFLILFLFSFNCFGEINNKLTKSLSNQTSTVENKEKENKEKTETKEEDKYVGEFFGIKVPKENYNFVKITISRFGNSFGTAPTTKENLEEAIWEQLLLSFIAFNQNITVSDDEFKGKIKEILESNNVNFDIEKDKEAYKKWVEEKFKEPAEVFENQIKHLTQIEKLYKRIVDAIPINIEDEQLYKEFLYENSSLNLEMASFKTEKEADDFYKKIANRIDIWEKEKKKNPIMFKRTGLVSAIALIDLWGIDEEIINKILKRRILNFYPPRKLNNDWVVFRILEKKVAKLENFKGENTKAATLNNLISRKKYEAVKEWFDKLKKEAQIKIYKKEEVK